MTKIAFCDDDRTMLEELSALLEKYREVSGRELEHTAFQSPLELMAAAERGARWDILLLDIVMPGESGMELARELRSADDHVKIIFLTSSPEFAVQSYSVGAFYYLLKPVKEVELFSILDRAVDQNRKARQESLILKCKTGITTVSPEDLEYCEVIGHSLLLHLVDGRVLESAGRLDELEGKLRPLGSFLRVHRSYLVNMACIRSIAYRAVTLASLTELPVPHGKYNEIKKIYLAYAFDRERVLI